MSIKSKLIIVFCLCFLPGLAPAGPCEEVAFSDPESFAEAMTEGLVLRERQDSLMNLYLTSKTPYPNSTGGKSLSSVLGALNRHPWLSKPLLRERILEFPVTKKESPPSLSHFIASFRKSTGQIRNNLFQIEANLGYWMKMLDFAPAGRFREKAHPPLSKEEKRAQREQEQKDFLSYLNTTALNEKTRLLVQDPSQPYRERTIALYRALDEIKSSYLSNPEVARRLSQAMAYLVHTVGFGNPMWNQALRSSDPKESFQALRHILNERDIVALELGFEGHFKELKKKLSTKIPDETQVLEQITKDVQNQSSVIKGTKTFRLRSLSLQESPFRSCLGGDCATSSYFEKALDPNFFYFTLTSKDHRSSGAIAVVLGTAENQTGQKVKVAFVDKIQNVQTDRVQAMLEGIRQILKEEGYILGLPEQVGSDYINGISNEALMSSYVESEILPKLNNQFKEFVPHEHAFESDNAYSRAGDRLPLLEFESPALQGVQIKAGALPRPQLVRADLNIQSLYEPILSLKNSTKEAEQLKFLSHLLSMRQIEQLKISDQYIKEHLDFVMQNPDFSFKVRKQAFWTMLRWVVTTKKGLSNIPHFKDLQDKTQLFSEKEQQVLIGEMSNWKNTQDWRADVIKALNNLTIYFPALERLLDSPWSRLVDKDLLLVNFTKAIADEGRKMVVVKRLLEAGADVNAKDNDGQTALMLASTNNRRDLRVASELLKAGADVNAKGNDGQTALMLASWVGKEVVSELLKAGADVNAKDNDSWTALMLASRAGRTEVVDMLLKAGADMNAKDTHGQTALMLATTREHPKVVDLLLKAGAKR